MACFSLFYIIKKTVMQLVSKMVHLNGDPVLVSVCVCVCVCVCVTF